MKKNLNYWLLAVLAVLLIAAGVYLSDAGAREPKEPAEPEALVVHPPRDDTPDWVKELPKTVAERPRYEVEAKAAAAVTVASAEPEGIPQEEAVPWTWDEVAMLSKAVWGEARGCSRMEQAAVVWCILNRVDDPRFPDSIAGVVTQPWQFSGYSPDNPAEWDIARLVTDVLSWWCAGDDTGRVLPREYLYFSGDGVHNYFTTEYQGGVTWDWSLPDIYGKEIEVEAQDESALSPC